MPQVRRMSDFIEIRTAKDRNVTAGNVGKGCLESSGSGLGRPFEHGSKVRVVDGADELGCGYASRVRNHFGLLRL